ncbi:MAG: cytochrome c oxidase subunit 3 [Chitinophagales bacterium]|nr:cytochrome c oxidase subunit 3 [Chitinophagales bacterium]MCZ2393839.1 cytochrome c oxidase subunit 3 [Chitinophagales bacterium]
MSVNKNIAYPPGGVLMWIIIYLELATFGMAMAALAFYGAADRINYHQDSLMLNKLLGTINTLFLLSGGFFAAYGVQTFKKNQFELSARYLLGSIFTGLGFLLLKIFEYQQKLASGLDMNYSPFFMNYWLLTGFHWIHVLVGVVILIFIRRTIVKNQQSASLEDIEAGVAFWHMCDLIWLLLFPLLYFLF